MKSLFVKCSKCRRTFYHSDIKPLKSGRLVCYACAIEACDKAERVLDMRLSEVMTSEGEPNLGDCVLVQTGDDEAVIGVFRKGRRVETKCGFSIPWAAVRTWARWYLPIAAQMPKED